jgi:hypothetical protein
MIRFYMDVHIPKAITIGLKLREVDVITAQEDNAVTLPDPCLLERATELQRVLFTFDDDLLCEATKRQMDGVLFGGVIYAHLLKISIGKCISDLELIAKSGEPADLMNRVEFLPL